MLELRADFSRRILMQLLLAFAFLIVAVVINGDFIVRFYLQDQRTYAGVIVNAAILVLFLAGLLRVVLNLRRLSREEAALVRFVDLYARGALKLLDKAERESLIVRRYEAIERLVRHNAAVDHSALAATLVAAESTRSSFPKFVNGILVLMGVFGTLVALSIALVGASGLLEGGQEVANMSLVIHGMATASSCTMTAIVCYVFLGYFYLRMTDAHTQVLGNIEQVTTALLLPKHTHDADGLVRSVGSLVEDLREAVSVIAQAQQGYIDAGRALAESVLALDLRTKQMVYDVGLIRRHLRDGFRLPQEPTS
jgi:hypothetical protein